MRESKEFPSIRQAAKMGPVGENTLRLMLKKGELPGFYVGRNYRVNYIALLERLRSANGEHIK